MSKQPGLPVELTRQVREACLCLHTQRAARVLARHFDEVFRPLGLTNGQYSLLHALNRPQPPAMGEVAELLAMDRTTLTAALKALERRGVVAIRADEKDRRSRRLSLTSDGRALLAEAYPLWQAAHAALDRALGPDGSAATRGQLGELVRYLSATD